MTFSGVGLMRGGLWGKVKWRASSLEGQRVRDNAYIHYHGISVMAHSVAWRNYDVN